MRMHHPAQPPKDGLDLLVGHLITLVARQRCWRLPADRVIANEAFPRLRTHVRAHLSIDSAVVARSNGERSSLTTDNVHRFALSGRCSPRQSAVPRRLRL